MFDPKSDPPTTNLMLGTFLQICTPIIISSTLGRTTMINSVFAGHMDDSVQIAVVGLSATCCNMMVQTVLSGVNCAQDSFTSQAFGADQKHKCGIILNRGLIIQTLAFLAFATWPCFFGEKILVAVGIDAEVSRLTQIQMRVTMPGVFFYGHFDLLKKWLASMRITFFPMKATITSSVLYIFLCFLFVVYFDMGIIGLAVALSIKECAQFLMTFIYCYWSESVSKVLTPLDSESFEGLSEYLELSIASIMMTCGSRWASLLITFMAGVLGVV